MAAYPPKDAEYVISSMLMDSRGSVGIESIGFRYRNNRGEAEEVFEVTLNEIAAGELYPGDSPILVVMTHRGKMIAATVVR